MAANIYDFKVKSIDGNEKSLSDYRGKVLLIVNVASECGYTPQYKGLEELNREYCNRGLAVLGFPANEFGAQEPGSDSAIKTFCESRFNVTFDMFSKVKVKGEGTHPLFDFLQSSETNPQYGGPIAWNFHKYLIGKNGEILGRYPSKVEPTSPELKQAIEQALK